MTEWWQNCNNNLSAYSQNWGPVIIRLKYGILNSVMIWGNLVHYEWKMASSKVMVKLINIHDM